jgi:hypothetical protein
MNKNDAMREIIENHTGMKIDDKRAAAILDSWYTYLEQLSPFAEKMIPILKKKDDLADLRESVDKLLSKIGVKIDWWDRSKRLHLHHKGTGNRIYGYYEPYWREKNYDTRN